MTTNRQINESKYTCDYCPIIIAQPTNKDRCSDLIANQLR